MRTLGQIVLGIIIGIVLLIGGGLVWYKVAYPTYTFRYRMTVEVEANGKVQSGSSVIEVQISTQPPILGPALYVPYIRGDAVFVDLGNGRNVIALLAAGSRAENVNYSDMIVPGLFDVPFKDWAKLSDLRGRREVPASRMPTFVTFTDINDPKSVSALSVDEFERVLGPKVRFKRVSIEMTTDPITKGIESKLPWLAHTERYRTVPTNPFTSTLKFGRHLFIREQ